MSELLPATRIEGLFLGKIQERWGGKPPSAIAKTPAADAQKIEAHGFINDAQADLENHGGLDKAIHHYPSEHYSTWIAESQLHENSVPACFGENIASYGMIEDLVCIGDIFRLGTATVQISQGRQPCWKVAEYTGNRRMAYLFQKTGRTGWYYRVLENGFAGTGDGIELLERPQPNWSVKLVTAARLSRHVTREDAETLGALPELADGWRQAFAKFADGNIFENTSRRLQSRDNDDNRD